MATLPVAVAQSSSDNVIQYVLPVLWMMLCFHIIKPMGRMRDNVHILSN